MKQRITVIVDPDEYYRQRGWTFAEDMVSRGVLIESAEDIPGPNRVQEFRVQVKSKGGLTAGIVDDVLNGLDSFVLDNVTIVEVTEVDPS